MTSMRARVSASVSRRGRAVIQSLVLLAGVLLCLGPAARAQVVGSSGKSLGSLSVYGLASADDNQFRQYKNFPKSLGYTAGVSIDRKGLFGLALEGSAIKWRSPLHDYTALAGPRVSFRIRRFRPYGEGLVGIGHASYVVTSELPAVHTAQTFGLAYGVAAGLDLRLSHHFTWRVAQGNFTRFSVGPGVTTKTGSSGILFRF